MAAFYAIDGPRVVRSPHFHLSSRGG